MYELYKVLQGLRLPRPSAGLGVSTEVERDQG